MTPYTYELTAKSRELLKTEILFAITSAKAKEIYIVRLNYQKNSSKTCINNIISILRTAKKNSQIQLYISPLDLDEGSTEAEYIRNKYPQLANLPKEENCFIVKI